MQLLLVINNIVVTLTSENMATHGVKNFMFIIANELGNSPSRAAAKPTLNRVQIGFIL